MLSILFVALIPILAPQMEPLPCDEQITIRLFTPRQAELLFLYDLAAGNITYIESCPRIHGFYYHRCGVYVLDNYEQLVPGGVFFPFDEWIKPFIKGRQVPDDCYERGFLRIWYGKWFLAEYNTYVYNYIKYSGEIDGYHKEMDKFPILDRAEEIREIVRRKNEAESYLRRH